MLTQEDLQAIEKSELNRLVFALQPADLDLLVNLLNEKDDNLRYKAFLLLQARSQACADVYAYWNLFVEKLGNENSYQRSLGLMLLAENARWDEKDAFGAVIERYLERVDDEKPVTVRQCVQGLAKIVPFKPQYNDRVAGRLMAVDLAARKDTQRKILLLDIINILLLIQKERQREDVERYIHHALTGGILDEKAKKEIIKQL